MTATLHIIRGDIPWLRKINRNPFTFKFLQLWISSHNCLREIFVAYKFRGRRSWWMKIIHSTGMLPARCAFPIIIRLNWTPTYVSTRRTARFRETSYVEQFANATVKNPRQFEENIFSQQFPADDLSPLSVRTTAGVVMRMCRSRIYKLFWMIWVNGKTCVKILWFIFVKHFCTLLPSRNSLDDS